MTTAPPRRWRTPLRVLLALVLAAVAFVGIKIGPLLLAPNDYAGVASIEALPTYRDPALMQAAWALPVAQRYRQSPYEFQHNQSFCGPTSVADLMHSLGLVATQASVIDGTRYEPWFGVLLGGLTLDELADLMHQRLGRPVTVERGLSLAAFRAELAHINDPDRRYIANFHRGPLFGRGHGHFSPLIAWLPARDLVLVGDVNARYRPFLASSERLWRAVSTIDEATGKPRGLIRVTVPADRTP